MKRILLAALLAALAALAATAGPIGTWTLHKAYHDATATAAAGRTVYALYDGNLLAYDTETEEVSLLSKTTGLSDRHISLMAYAESERCLVLAYDNGNVDLLFDDGSVVNMPQLKNSGDADYTPADITLSGSTAVLATAGGVALLDLRNHTVRSTYRLGERVHSAAIFDGYLYAALTGRLRRGRLADNLLDAAAWQDYAGLQAYHLVPCAGRLFFTAGGAAHGFWRIDPDADGGGRHAYQRIWLSLYTTVWTDGRQAVMSNPTELAVYTADHLDQPTLSAHFENSWNGLTRGTDGTFWAADGENGLRAYTLGGHDLADTGQAIGGYGPRRDLAYRLRFEGDRLLVAGGRFDYSGRQYPGTLMYYENGTWTNFAEKGIAEATGLPYRNIMSAAQDPADPDHHFASSSAGLYEYRDGRYVRLYNARNSTLRAPGSAPRDTARAIADGLAYDADGNLWMTNYEADTVLNVRRPDGRWLGVYVDDIKGIATPETIMFDSRGRLWMTSRRWANSRRAGFLCLDYNGTPDNDNDDIATFRYSMNNQDGTPCTFEQGAYAMMEDADGAIWLGAASGLYVVADPGRWFDADFRITQIKVPRNDGTNYADYLLAGVAVTAIARDGAGRKWIGTASNGLYLVSDDGTEIIHHFTADDTPLLSDNIYSLAVSPATGEVFIGTDAGLCSYQSDASEPMPALAKGNVKVYPNPVRPEHRDGVVVSGLTAGADVKVTTASGRVVAGGTSNGGTFTWDCRSADGARVATGVYYFMISTADGNKGVAAKVVVI